MADETADEAPGDEPEPEPAFKGFIKLPDLGALFGGGGPSADDLRLIGEVQKRLGGPAGETSFVDYLRTEMRKQYVPLSFVDKVHALRDALGAELFGTLSRGKTLKWAAEEWEADRLRAVYDWTVRAVLERVNKDEVCLTRHQVEPWMKKNLCFCGRCWKTD